MKRITYILGILLILTSPVFSQIDRTHPPKPLLERAINFGKTNSFILANGLRVVVVENRKLPVVSVSLKLDITAVKEGDKSGYLDMFGSMLRAGTQNFTKEQLDEKIDYLGTDFSTGSTGISFSSLSKQLIPSIEIMRELLFKATFTNQSELSKLKKQGKTALEMGEKNPDIIVDRVSKVLLFGKNDPWGEYSTPRTLDNIVPADFKNYYTYYFKPNIAYLSFVGDISSAEAKQIAEKYFGDWKPGEVKENYPSLIPHTAGITLALVDLPSATQSSIEVINLVNLKKSDKDFFPVVLGNSILGDGSSGRLFKDIREKHGWTYDASSQISDSYRRLGTFSASTKVRNNVTDSAVVEILKNIHDITTQAPSVEEINTKKAEYSGNFALSLETPQVIAGFIVTQIQEKLPQDFYKNYLKNINKVSATEIPSSLYKTIDPKNLTILIVGKAKEILPGLKKLGYPIVLYDGYGNPVKKPVQPK